VELPLSDIRLTGNKDGGRNRNMKSHRLVAVAVAFALANGAAQTALFAAGQQSATIAGTAKDEAKKPYTDNSVRARDTASGQIAGTTTLNADGNFSLAALSSAKYLIELVNKDGKVVCTEGPFDLTQQMLKNDVVIDCDKVPAAWWLLGAAAAAGITAGVVAANASPSQ
jgi:hypothetical protein